MHAQRPIKALKIRTKKRPFKSVKTVAHVIPPLKWYCGIRFVTSSLDNMRQVLRIACDHNALKSHCPLLSFPKQKKISAFYVKTLYLSQDGEGQASNHPRPRRLHLHPPPHHS